jgi:hypothetical protein
MKVGLAPLLLAAVLAAGCGSATAGPANDGEPAGVLQAAPPIEAVDEPADSIALISLEPDAHGDAARTETICSVVYAEDEPVAEPEPLPEAGETTSSSCDELSAEEKARFEELEREFRKRVEPAPGSEPRTIAKLRLSGERVLKLAAWRSTSGLLCFAEAVSEPDGGGGTGPGGPCLGEDDVACTAALCLESSGHGPPMQWNLAGVVSSDGEELRITNSSGMVRRYPLSGPVVPGFPEYRVFMLGLGRDDYVKLELLRAGVVVAEQELPPWVVQLRKCQPDKPGDPLEECAGSAK